MKTDQRIFGLDLLRALAILAVIGLHVRLFLNPGQKLWEGISIPDPVDLFFVLSGYLLGNIILRQIDSSGNFTFAEVKHFLVRRWFRTLPNYYLFLILNMVLISLGLIKGEVNLLSTVYFFFSQNLFKPFDFMFWESWTITIEEWFYLIFPFLLFLMIRVKRKELNIRTSFVIVVLLFLLLPLFYRILVAPRLLDWDLYFRKLIPARFDIIGFGLLGAYIHYYYLKTWEKFRILFFVFGLCSIIFNSVSPLIWHAYYHRTFYFTFMGFSWIMLFPLLTSLNTENIPLKPFRFISLISYSLYLLHLPLIQILEKINASMLGLGKNEFVWMYLALLFIFSSILYYAFEKPITRLRESWSFSKMPN